MGELGPALAGGGRRGRATAGVWSSRPDASAAGEQWSSDQASALQVGGSVSFYLIVRTRPPWPLCMWRER
jgi:hypothetical protein